ncbi:CLUMA_CG011123, isoform A [Clunio marinus]|uniref:Protein amnionless n=1 Tax=Clunio marinus TaxID=568069 RepID=A0A1J1IFG3_9DIPT|nr:CLUMA_CG011123, isoform A [Clunio marinus]
MKKKELSFLSSQIICMNKQHNHRLPQDQTAEIKVSTHIAANASLSQQHTHIFTAFPNINVLMSAEFLGLGESRRIIWNQRTNIGDANNWEDNKMPCSSDALHFPQRSYDLIKLSNFSMKEIILPKTGGFILDSQTTLNFHENDPQCKPNETKMFKSVIQSPWLSTSNWNNARDVSEIEVDDEFYNKATPHEERLPCDNDEVIFPINNSYVVDLQSIPSLSFKTIAINGRILSIGEFKEFLSSTFGQSMFKNVENTIFDESSCIDENKCVCHRKNAALMEQLCSNEMRDCRSIPPCTDPIEPIGHCCFECGALFQMKLNAINNFQLKTFKRNIAEGE